MRALYRCCTAHSPSPAQAPWAGKGPDRWPSRAASSCSCAYRSSHDWRCGSKSNLGQVAGGELIQGSYLQRREASWRGALARPKGASADQQSPSCGSSPPLAAAGKRQVGGRQTLTPGLSAVPRASATARAPPAACATCAARPPPTAPAAGCAPSPWARCSGRAPAVHQWDSGGEFL